MLDKIKRLLVEQKGIIANFSYLSILQIFNMALPLITYPYLIRVLGKETYGLVVFAQAIIGYLVILVCFGFNISATMEISIHRENKEKLSEIISSVLSIKLVSFVLALLILYFSLMFIPQAKSYKVLFYLTMWMCLYDLLFPMWYFQGIEQMKYITLIILISRLTFLGLIFVFIHSPEDYLFLPIINGIGALLAGGISLYIIFAKHKLHFQFQKFSTLKKYFTDAIPIFISNVSIRLYVSTNKVLVGAFLGMGEVAYYDLAEKIVSVLRIPQGILSQVLFPKISKDKNLFFVRKVFKISIVLNIAIFIALLCFSKYIIEFLGGIEMLPTNLVLLILGATVPIVAMSNIFGIQLLIPFGFSKQFSQVVLLSGLIYLSQMLILWFVDSFTINSIAMVTVLTELFVTTYMFYFCLKNKLWKKNTITSL